MNYGAQLLRWGGWVTLVGGGWTLVTLAFPVQGGPANGWYIAIGHVLSMFALFSIFAAQAESSGMVGLVGFVFASTGNALLLTEGTGGDMIFTIGAMLYALGLIVLALGTWKAGVFSRWVPGLWIAAILVGIPAFFLNLPPGWQYVPGGICYGFSLLVAGYELGFGRRQADMPHLDQGDL